jgi:hypothetical protein
MTSEDPYEIRDVLDGVSRIENIEAATRMRSEPRYAEAFQRVREVCDRIRALVASTERSEQQPPPQPSEASTETGSGPKGKSDG